MADEVDVVHVVEIGVSGTAECSCGWKSGHYAHGGDLDLVVGHHLVHGNESEYVFEED